MNPRSRLAFIAAALTGLLPFSIVAPAQTADVPEPHEAYGVAQSLSQIHHLQIRNPRDERLGHVEDIVVDLTGGRIVEVLIVTGDFLGFGGKVVAVPPAALAQYVAGDVLWLNVSKEDFKAAPAIDLSAWRDHCRSDRVAAVYRRFGAEPYFLENGDTADLNAARPLVRLGPVARASKVIGMRVQNKQGVNFGKVWRIHFGVTAGRVQGVVIKSSGKFSDGRLVPAMALSYSYDRSYLILDDTRQEFADEPSYQATAAANGQKEHFKQETATGPRTNVALKQGLSYFDIDLTLMINRQLRADRLPIRDVEVGTLHGRVTLRGWVPSEAARLKVAAIAVAASRLELVDDQLVVGPRPAGARTGRL